jgi:UDP-glucose 4-epimerase
MSDGHEVVVLDNLVVGKLSNLDAIKGHPRFSFFKADVSEISSIEQFFTEVDWVFHLAALADIVPSIENPDSYFSANVIGSYNVAKLSTKYGVNRLLYAASSSCYGIPTVYPTAESAPCNPEYPYALTKYLGEQIMIHWNRVYGLPVTCLRLFNVYGPRARTSGSYGAVFGVFLAQKLAGKPFTVVGDGSQTRDFTYVSDVSSAFIAAAKNTDAGYVLNVGSGSSYSVNEVISHLDGPVVNIPKRPAEPDVTFADISRIKEVLGWQPQVTLESGIRQMLEKIQDWSDAPVWEPETIAAATSSWFRYLAK